MVKNESWCESFFESLLDIEVVSLSKQELENKLWVALNRTPDRLKFSFALKRITYYFKVEGYQTGVKWNLIGDDFPELKPRIKKLMKQIEARK